MPSGATLALFVPVVLVLLLTPGPAVLYIVARALEQGRIAGLVSGLGLSCGGLVHVAAATIGMTSILAGSQEALRFVQWAGAAYLVYLGVRTLVSARATDDASIVVDRRSLRRIFRDGVVVNLLNPKALVFTFAFLPQFVDPARGSVGVQTLVLGLMLVGMGWCTDALWALAAGTVGIWWRRHPGAVVWQRRLSGCVYLGMGTLLIRP